MSLPARAPRLLVALLLLVAALAVAACGGDAPSTPGSRTKDETAPQRAPAPPRPIVLATGLSEANPELLFAAASARDLAPGFAAWRDRLVALRPRYLRVPIYWSQLQPDPAQPARLDQPADGCLRGIPPCGASNGLRDQLAAIASLQRTEGLRGGPEVEVVIAGVPAWAANPPSGCERSDAGPSSRPINAIGLTAYRALITQFAALAREQGARVRWWSPWNEPNHPAFISPQRATCSSGSASLAPAVYAQLVRAARDTLNEVPGDQQLVLGEMAGTTTPSPRRSTIQEMVAALPDDVVCSTRTWSQHDYAQVTPDPGKPDPVAALEQALDARACTRGAHVWVTETGVGGDPPGRDRPTGDAALRAQCRAQDGLLRQWAQDPRVDVAFQYTFREDTAYPVGLADAALTRTYPTYELWKAWGGTRSPSAPPPPLPATCE
ncbi:MAG TPA: hypothetical protein VGO71_15720 [Baekduia sp.]|nr:hypothetical protein [Baekduia sp.]